MLKLIFVCLDEETNKLIKSKGWKKMDDNYVFCSNHEEIIKTKNIVEKIKFDGTEFLSYYTVGI